MATALYRLGKWASHHARIVVAVWLVLLAAVSSAAMGLGPQLTTKISIPGTDFERVSRELKTQIPQAAGGSGTVVFSTDGAPFTAAQKQAVADASTRWTKVAGVTSARDPFVTQATIDGSAAQLAEAQAKLDAGTKQLAGAPAQLAAAQAQLDAAQAKLDAGRAQLAPAQAKIAAAEKQIAALTAAGQSAAARAAAAQLAPAKAQVAAGTAQLDAAAAQLDQGRKTLATKKAEYDAGVARLAAAKTQLEVGKRQAALVSGMRVVSADQTVAVSQVGFATDVQSITKQTRDDVIAIGRSLSSAGLHVDFGNELFFDLTSIIGPSEITGVVVAALVLLIALGSLIAAGLPLLMAITGVGVGIGSAMAYSHFSEMNSVTPALGLMIGLAVGIDYSLFIVNRHRTQLLAGVENHESIGRATGTSGNAVTFAGLTVIVALAALGVTGIQFLGLMGNVAAVTVALAVLVAITLTPALLGALGHRILSRRAWRQAGIDPTAAHVPQEGATAIVDHEAQGSARWGRFVTGHPWLGAAVGLVVLGILAIPAASLRLGLPDGGSEPKDSSAYRAYHLVADKFGPGVNGPIVAVAHLARPATGADAVEVLSVAERLKAVPGVDRVVPIGTSTDSTIAAYQLLSAYGPADERTVDTVKAIRDAAPQVAADTGASVEITGMTVANIDISAKLADALPRYLAIVVGLSLLILLLVFRSVVVPLLATLGFLLSLAAAFGCAVAVYQWGWLASLFGISQPAPLLSFLPTILIGVLFGLAMDYQMFLVTGMREAHRHGQEARAAVLTGYRHGARVVTAAAIIMVSVFAGFIFAHLTMIRPIGFGLAMGVALDAFLVRMTVTPAVMTLLGERAWWLPKWLDRVLPDVDVEGVKLLEALDRGTLGR